MLRRLSMTSVAVATALVCSFADCQTCEAQGLLRRIQSRIQSRIQPVPPAEQPAQSPSAQKRVQPERARPIAPSVRPNSAKENSPTKKNSGTSYRTPSSTSRKSTIDANKYGSSILAPNQPDVKSPDLRNSDPKNAGPIDSPRVAAADRPTLAIQVLESQTGTPGLEVAGIRADSLADDAGLKVGDLIVEIDGKPTPKIADVAQYINGLKSGDRVRAKIVRGRTTAEIMIPLMGSTPPPADPFARAQPAAPTEPVEPAKPSGPADPFAREPVAAAEPSKETPDQPPASPTDLGIKVETPPGVRGVVVANVRADSPAAAAGLKVGDRIVSVEGRLVISGDSFNREVAKQSADQQLSVQLVRGGKLIATDVRLSDQEGLAKTQTAKPKKAAEKDGSVLEGIGSVLGGLLGGKKSDSKADPKKVDEMALGDEKPIQQVDFESEVEPDAKKLHDDPPSLEALELPPGKAKPIEPKATSAAKKTIEQLREEVRRLEEQLKELEASE